MRTLALLVSLGLVLLAAPALVLLNLVALSFHWTDIVGYVVVAAVVYGLLYAVGQSLNKKFNADVDAFLRAESADLAPRRGLLRTFGFLLVVLLPFLVYLMLLSVFLAASFGIYGYWLVSMLPTVPVVVLVALAVVVLGSGAGLFIGLFRLLFPPKPKTFGAELREHQQPELWALSREVAAGVGTKVADRIVLTPDPGISVHLSGALFATLLGGGERVLQLGVPSIHELTVAELRAILAHEYGHFSNRDTQWITFTYALGNGLTAALKATPGPMKTSTHGLFALVVSLNPGYWTLRLFLKLFARVTSAFSRIREVMADIRAMKLYGGEPFAKGLAKVCFNDAVFADVVQRDVVPTLLKEDKVVSNFANVMAVVTKEATAEQRAQATTAGEANEYDSHPPVATRLSYAIRFPADAATADTRDVSTLFREWEPVNEEVAMMYNQRLFAYLHSLQGARQAAG